MAYEHELAPSSALSISVAALIASHSMEMAKRVCRPQVSGQGRAVPSWLLPPSFCGFVFRPSSFSLSLFLSGLCFSGVEKREFANISKETRCPRAQISRAKCGRGRVLTCLPG